MSQGGAVRTAAGLAYDRVGTGPPLVLVHGLASSRRAWDLVAPRLAGDFTVIAVDLPGHGDSVALPRRPVAPGELAARLADFLDELGIDRPHLVGNSLGGWVALEAAAGGRARSVVALAPAGLGDVLGAPSPLLRANRIAATVTRPLQPTLLSSTTVRRIAFRSGVERPEALSYRTALDAALAQADATGFDACLAGTRGRRFERADEIGADVPVTIAFGDRDRILPAPGHQRRDRAPAGARWLVLWRCGHAPMWDVPLLTCRIVRSTAAVASGA